MLWRRPILAGPVLVSCLVGIVYMEENLRGRHEWEKCKRELEAKGAALDWFAFCPTKVPDEENILSAPKMRGWFAEKGPNAITKNLSLNDLADFAKQSKTNILAEVTLVPPEARVASGDADLVLSYADALLELSTFSVGEAAGPASTQVIPLIVLDEVPLTAAIRNLARQAGLDYEIDPACGLTAGAREPTVSARWSDFTARQALFATLDKYCLQMVRRPSDGVMQIELRGQSRAKPQIAPAARELPRDPRVGCLTDQQHAAGVCSEQHRRFL